MISILCAGSRGDVQPYLGLAVELRKLGHPVRIAVTKDYAELVRRYKIDCFTMNADFESVGVDPQMIRQAQQADNPLKMFLSFQQMKHYAVHLVEEYFAACEGSDLVVYHPGATIGYFAAQKLGFPAVLASPFPLHKTRQQTSVVLYGKVRSNPLINTVSYILLQRMLWMAAASSLKSFWKEKFGHLPQDFGIPFERHNDVRHPALVSCSNHVFARPSDWNEHIHQLGYWFVEEPEEYIPHQALADFLASGEKPVYVGFGSMFNRDETTRTTRIVIEGLTLAGKRGILSGMGTLPDLAKTMLPVENIPHTWLFERMAAVVHHGGAGTSAAGFRAGVPSLILPHALDQYAWAQRSFELGVGAKPIPIKKLTPENFAEALQLALQPAIVEKARELAHKIEIEDGARRSARLIASLLEG
jgi:sterol 3beta-glucosyltransferase